MTISAHQQETIVTINSSILFTQHVNMSYGYCVVEVAINARIHTEQRWSQWTESGNIGVFDV